MAVETLLREPTVSVILPCLNEVNSVGLCVREAIQVMGEFGIDGEVLVVDNGSTDGSAEVARSAGARVIVEPRPGYGSALQAGMAAANGSILVMADADWTYDLRKIPQLVAPIRDQRADLVVGSRLENLERASMPFLHRYVGTPVLNFLLRRATGGHKSIRDSQSGFRALRRDSLSRLGLRASGMEFASEMLIRAGHQGLRIETVITGYRSRIGRSKLSSFADGLRHLKLILLLAPELVLVTPGAVMFLVGLVLSALTLASPAGIAVGSVRWQPVFFSTIALVLGLQSTLMGAILAQRSSLVDRRVHRTFAFVATRRFVIGCVSAGLVALASGLMIDFLLLAHWVTGGHPFSRALALASIAQSLLLAGGSLLSVAFVDWCLKTWDWRRHS